MRVIDTTPDYYVEKAWLASIAAHLETWDITMLIRDQNMPSEWPKEKYISIITSTEKHDYLPYETVYENCLGVFMNYGPCELYKNPYDVDMLAKVDKLYNIPLGYHKGFCEPLNNNDKSRRPIDVTFWGQYDPYRRANFYNACMALKPLYNTSFLFYDGWGKGPGHNEYQLMLDHSKIALVPWGSASRNTFRYYESYFSGCVVICNEQYDTWYKNPNEIICKDDWSDLQFVVEKTLNNYDVSKQMCNDYCCEIDEWAVAKYIWDTINANKN